MGLHGGCMRALVTATVQLLRNEESEEHARSGLLRGIWIAVATFVPTFLTVLLGTAYLADLPTGTGIGANLRAGSEPGMSAPPLQRNSVTIPRRSEAPTKALASAAGGATSRAVPRPVPRPAQAEAKRSASTVTKDATWVRGGAFPDRDTADRLAASVERRGYPAKVRRDDRAWVVWIWKHPPNVRGSAGAPAPSTAPGSGAGAGAP